LLFAPEAKAQVIINQAALDQLAGIKLSTAAPGAAAPPVITATPSIRHLPRKAAYRQVLRRGGSLPHLVASSRINKQAPAVAVSAPKPVSQPVVAKPALPPAPPKPLLPHPAIIDFTAGGSDLPGDSAAVLKPFCAHSGNIVTIDAYATANPNDPSQAARLSMSRAFAIRDALTACGVHSSNIIPRANGAAKTADPDTAEVSASP
jgi:hypothetical protein